MRKAEPYHALLGRAKGLVHQRSAVCPGTHADAVVLPQDICHPGRILLSDVQRHNGCTGLHGHITVHRYTRCSTHLLIKQAGKGVFPGGKAFYALLQQPVHPGT